MHWRSVCSQQAGVACLGVQGGREATLHCTHKPSPHSNPPMPPTALASQAKDASAGIGTAVAAVGGTAEPPAPAAPPAPSGTATFNLVLRCARTVQEVALQATCSREEVRKLIATCISQLAAEVDAAAEDDV